MADAEPARQAEASIVVACVPRNRRHVVPVFRCGAGGIFSCLRIRRMLEAPTWWPSFSSSPWIRMSHPASRRRIRYSRRIDTAGHHARAPDRSRICGLQPLADF